MAPKKSLKIAKGTDITLNCTIHSAVVEKVTNVSLEWRFGEKDRKLTTTTGRTTIKQDTRRMGSNVTINSELVIRDVGEQNQGAYHCVAILKAGMHSNVEVYDTVNVTITSSKQRLNVDLENMAV